MYVEQKLYFIYGQILNQLKVQVNKIFIQMQRGQPIPALGQDVVMDDAFAAVGGAAGAVAAANAAGKKGFFKGKFGGVCKIVIL